MAVLLFLVPLTAGCPPAGEPAVPPKAPARKPAEDGALLGVTVEGVLQLSGRYWSGDMVCLPPASRVKIKPVSKWPRTSLGNEKEWKAAGGTFEKKADGSLQLFTPQLAGARNTLNLSAGPGAKPVLAHITIAILHEAEIARSKRTGRWRVRIAREFSHTYPNPAKARSWRVRRHKHLYAPPRFWMKITPENGKQLLAPHLQVGQMVGFVTTKDKSKPKRRHSRWFPLNRPLVYKLEILSRELLAKKVKFKRLAINSCFRTPRYNRKIGGSSFSRHIYGDAADVMIDRDGDEVCDDITADGAVDEKDGLAIGRILRRLEKERRVRPGGIGVYGFDKADSARSYVHLDARGFLTRWGAAYKGGRRRTLKWWPPEEYREDQKPPEEGSAREPGEK